MASKMDLSFKLNTGVTSPSHTDDGLKFNVAESDVYPCGFRAGVIILDGQQVILHLRASGPRITTIEMRGWALILSRFR